MAFGTFTRDDNFSTLYVGGPVTGPALGRSDQDHVHRRHRPAGRQRPDDRDHPVDRRRSAAASDRRPQPASPSTLYTYNDANGLIALEQPGIDQLRADRAGTDAQRCLRRRRTTRSPATRRRSAGDLSIRSSSRPDPDVRRPPRPSPARAHADCRARGRSPTSSSCVFNGPTLNFGSATRVTSGSANSWRFRDRAASPARTGWW